MNTTKLTTIPEVIDAALRAQQQDVWLNCTFHMLAHSGQVRGLGIKSFGLWVQRLEMNGMKTSVPECKTHKAFKEALRAEIEGLLRHA